MAVVWAMFWANAQGQCPLVFVQGNSASLWSEPTLSGLQRLPDGSFTLQQFQWTNSGPEPALGPKIGDTPDFEQTLVNCSAAGPRSFQVPAGWRLLSDQLGTTSRNPVIGDLIGNGTMFAIGSSPTGGNSMDVVVFNSDITTKSSTILQTGNNPEGYLVADFNGDGIRDLLVVTYGDGTSGQVTVYLSNGDGTLEPGISSPAGSGPASAAAFDFNKDGKLDVAIASFSGGVSILLGNGDGTFAPPASYPTGTISTSVAAADLNGDGNADLVVGNVSGTESPGTLSVLIGDGKGAFKPATTVVSNLSPLAVAIGDLNKDGKPDLAVSDNYSGILTVMLGDGKGGFSQAGQYLALSNSLFITDVDGDGNPDVVIASGHPDGLMASVNGFLTSSMMVLFGKGDGTLIGAPAYSTGAFTDTTPNSIALADFNGDGIQDMAVAANGSEDVWVMLGNSNGTFQTPTRMAFPGPGVWAGSVVAADLTGSGKQDLVVANLANNNVWVFLGSGTGTFQTPVSSIVGGTSVTSLAVADFNGDHKLDLVATYSGSPGGVALLLGNGNGSFTLAQTFNAGANPLSARVGDFNKDGKLDFAVVDSGVLGSSADPGGAFVFLGSGAGNFQPAVSYSAGVNPLTLAVGELNQDGVSDFVVGTGDSNGNYYIGVLLGNSNGTFNPISVFPTAFGPQSIALADLNGDGKLDVIATHCCGDDLEMTYLLGNGNGTLQSGHAAHCRRLAAGGSCGGLRRRRQAGSGLLIRALRN